jgi:hypothetical protein
VRDAFGGALVRSLDADSLRGALSIAVAGLLRESAQLVEVATKVEGDLRELGDSGR